MANYMFFIRLTSQKHKKVCHVCAERGEVIDSCKVCHGQGVKVWRIPAYEVKEKPVLIERVDRDPKTGILRYWEDASVFCYDAVDSSLNRYVPDVPYGVHLMHDSYKSAQAECERVNKYLADKAAKSNRVEELNFFIGG